MKCELTAFLSNAQPYHIILQHNFEAAERAKAVYPHFSPHLSHLLLFLRKTSNVTSERQQADRTNPFISSLTRSLTLPFSILNDSKLFHKLRSHSKGFRNGG